MKTYLVELLGFDSVVPVIRAAEFSDFGEACAAAERTFRKFPEPLKAVRVLDPEGAVVFEVLVKCKYPFDLNAYVRRIR